MSQMNSCPQKYHQSYKVSLKGVLNFEVRSLCGRLLLSSRQVRNLTSKKLLNLGCGSTKKTFESWINADFFAFRSKEKPDWMLDLRFPLNCEDEVWDGVFSEHTLEHLYPDQAWALLQELYRTMKPGSWIRITVPDLKKYVAHYCNPQEITTSNFTDWETGCEAVRSLTQNYFHLSLWDAELLGRYLIEAGFSNVSEVSFMQGSSNLLLKDKEERAWETLYMEAQKM